MSRRFGGLRRSSCKRLAALLHLSFLPLRTRAAAAANSVWPAAGAALSRWLDEFFVPFLGTNSHILQQTQFLVTKHEFLHLNYCSGKVQITSSADVQFISVLYAQTCAWYICEKNKHLLLIAIKINGGLSWVCCNELKFNAVYLFFC